MTEKSGKPDTVSMSLRIPAELHRQSKSAAALAGVTLASWILDLMNKAVKAGKQ